MKFTINQLKASEEVLISLSKEKFPIVVAYRLSKFLKVAGDELNKFDTKRSALIEKYGTVSAEGVARVTPENMDKFKDEIEPILKEEVDIPFVKLQFEDLKNVELTPTQAALLEYFVDIQ